MADKPFNRIPLTDGNTGVVHPKAVDIEDKNAFLTTYPHFNIPNKADLNTSDYLVVGTYQSGSGSNTFTNAPINGAWEMIVWCPIGVMDNYSPQDKATMDRSTWTYRCRMIIAYDSPTIYYQSISSGSTGGKYTYSAWTKIANVNDNVASATKLAIKRKIDGVLFDGTADIAPTAGDFSSNTLEDLVKSLQATTGGRVGSANIMKDSRVDSAWYNFLWMPHRIGYISDSNDNKDFGTLLLFGMTSDTKSWKIRTAKGGVVASIVDLNASATKLATSRTIQTDLGSTTAKGFDGTANVEPGVKGTLPVANGGTGATDAATARKNLGLDKVDNTADTDKVVKGLTCTNDKNYSIQVMAAPYYDFDDLGTKDYSEFFKLYLKELASNHANLAGRPISGCAQPATVVNVYGYLYDPVNVDSSGLPENSFFHGIGYNQYEVIFGTVEHEYYYREIKSAEDETRRYKVYFNTGGKYLKLGTLHTGQRGNYCLVKICYGNGYNAQLSQDQSQTIHFRTGNGTGDSYNAYVVNENPNCTNPYNVYINKVSNNEFEFWTDKLNYPGNSFAIFECYGTDYVTYGDWQTGEDSLPSGAWEVTKISGQSGIKKTITGAVELTSFTFQSNNQSNNMGIGSWSKDYTSEGLDVNSSVYIQCIASPNDASKRAIIQAYLEYGWLNIRLLEVSSLPGDTVINYTMYIFY